jgi:hypothetical protein
MVVGTLPNVVVLVSVASFAVSAASFNFILTDKLSISDPVPPAIECVSTKPALEKESLLSSALSRSQSYIKNVWFPNVFDVPCRYPVGPPPRSNPEKTKDVFAAAAVVAGEEELGVVVAVAMGDDDEEDREWRCYASGTHLPSNDPS